MIKERLAFPAAGIFARLVHELWEATGRNPTDGEIDEMTRAANREATPPRIYSPPIEAMAAHAIESYQYQTGTALGNADVAAIKTTIAEWYQRKTGGGCVVPFRR